MGGPWIPRFSGEKGKFSSWRSQVEAMLRAQGLTTQQGVDFLLAALDGEARRQARLFKTEEKADAKALLDALQSKYGDGGSRAQRRSRFFSCRQGQDEGVGSFILKLQELYFDWQGREPTLEEEGEYLLDQFTLNLRPGPIQQEIHRQVRRNPQLTFAAVCTEAVALEQEQQHGEDHTWVRRAVTPTVATSPVNTLHCNASDLSQLKSELQAELRKEVTEQLKGLSASIVEEIRKQISPTPLMASQPDIPPLTVIPPQLPSGPTARSRPQQTPPGRGSFQWDAEGRPICRDCGGVDFGFLVPPATEGRVAGTVAHSAGVTKSQLVGECPYVEVEANGKMISCVLDTGSQVTLVSKAFFIRHFGNIDMNCAHDSPWLTLRAVNGLQIPYVGYAIVDFAVGGVQIPQKGMVVVEDGCMGADFAILGMNVIAHCWSELTKGKHPGLTAFKSLVSPVAGHVWEQAFSVCQRVIVEGPAIPFQGVARLPRQPPVVIPPESEMVVWAQLQEGAPKMVLNALIEPLEDQDGEWYVARSLVMVSGGKLPMRMCNPNPYPVEVPLRRPLAKVTQTDECDVQTGQELVVEPDDSGAVEVAIRAVTNPSESSTLTDLHPCFAIEGDSLNPDQHQRLLQLLKKWISVFSSHDDDFGRTNAVQHQIPTGDAPPCRERYRPVPPSLYPELRTLLQGMLDSGVVRESSSPWAAPVVLVKKKDGSWRFCVDYRKLNAVTHKDAYPLPRIEESLTGLKRAQWYSTLDLASGYWQVEMDPQDRQKTAFTTPMGLYEFDRMPFGLCNAPATFQRLMQRCLGSMVHDFLLIYLDDVVVFSPDFDSHLHHLEQVFWRLHEHGLKLQPRKCKLFQQQVTYLGHVISNQGVATDPQKTAVVKEWPVPQTIKQVRSFLGFAGYYRRFIHGFSQIAAPLHTLLKGTATVRQGNTQVNWTEACQESFDRLKKDLVRAPVLAYADFSLPFRLYTDASLEGLGAVLAQEQDGQERVIAFASRSLHLTERNDQNYSSFKLELLALKWAITEKFKDYLWGATIEVFTDNNPLVHLATANLGAVEQRWANQLANYRYTIKFRPGRTNQNADALSRLPGECTEAVVRVVAEPADSAHPAEDILQTPDRWYNCQFQDPGLQLLWAWKAANTLPPPQERKGAPHQVKRLLLDWERIVIRDNLLKRRCADPRTGEVYWQVLVPEQEAQKLWQQYHESLGHQGAEKVWSVLRRRFFWPSMLRSVETWTAACPRCLRQKPGPGLRAPLVPIPTSYPFEVLGIDYLSLGRPGDPFPYILVMTDLFSKYAFAVPTKEQSATTTAKALYSAVIQVVGCPERILSDRGGAFQSAVMEQLCQLYGCKQSRTTPYHPQGNGVCERFNQTLLSLLSSLSEADQNHWPQSLPALLQAYNNTTHSSTGMTPHFIVFGRHARLPVDWVVTSSPPNLRYSLSDWVKQHYRTLTQAYNVVKANVQRQQQKDQRRYDRRAKVDSLLPGERVLPRNFRRRAKGKLAPRWGPDVWVVVARPRADRPVYVICPEGHEGPTKTIHRNNLRCCPVNISREDPLEGEPSISQPQPMSWYPVIAAPLVHQHQLTGHTSTTTSVVPNPEGGLLSAASGVDLTTQTPSPSTEEPTGELEHRAPPETVSCLPSLPMMSPTGGAVRRSQRSTRGQPPTSLRYTQLVAPESAVFLKIVWLPSNLPQRSLSLPEGP
ncbi:interleukin-1 receptor accessory protein-like 1-A [Pimephales promelas]|nr:interleukin-1 receptor accessory protein-like 1-A [Pimephales promelas]